ncbi:pilin [Patescibacteria group bacterium]|nr:pilin [Patescibacteria group bacterium]
MSFFSLKKSIVLFGLVSLIFGLHYNNTKAGYLGDIYMSTNGECLVSGLQCSIVTTPLNCCVAAYPTTQTTSSGNSTTLLGYSCCFTGTNSPWNSALCTGTCNSVSDPCIFTVNNPTYYKCYAQDPACSNLSCEAANATLPCACGTTTADAANPWCCAGNNAIYNTQGLCQVDACAPPPTPTPIYPTGGLVPCGRMIDNSDTTEIDESKPCDLCAAFYMLKNIINFVTELAVGIAVFILVIAGLLYVFSAGDPGKIESAKSAITYALMGLAIIFAAWLVIAVILQGLGYADINTWNQVNCAL